VSDGELMYTKHEKNYKTTILSCMGDHVDTATDCITFLGESYERVLCDKTV